MSGFTFGAATPSTGTSGFSFGAPANSNVTAPAPAFSLGTQVTAAPAAGTSTTGFMFGAPPPSTTGTYIVIK